MDLTEKPRLDLAKRVLPKQLCRALEFVFAQGLEGQFNQGMMLVGGTALSGFYAGHRRSDDLDLFVRDEEIKHVAVLAIKELGTIGVSFLEEFQTAQYYRATCELEKHRFTIDAVVDRAVFAVGEAYTLSNGVAVASLETLLRTKIATLVSRCSEKDLYDLQWLFENAGNFDFDQLIEFGRSIDGGLNGETLLLSMSGTTLTLAACDFGLSKEQTKERIFAEVQALKKRLVEDLSVHLKQPRKTVLKQIMRQVKDL